MAGVDLKVTIVQRTSLTANLSRRHNLSLHHLLAAALFSRLSARIERDNAGKISEELRTEHRAYVVGAITAAVASMEATINELYLDAKDKNPHTFKGLDPLISELLAELWEEIEERRILKKYQVALIVAKKEPFPYGKIPYQDVDYLITLRNALIHSKPEWETDQKKHKNIENRLRSRFTLNPFAHANDVFFPTKCLSHGCAKWAVSSSIKFMEEFFSRMGLQRNFDPWRLRLNTE